VNRIFFTVVLCTGVLLAETAALFEPVPAAVRALKVTRSKKPSRDGFVFACGHYVKPPYKVMRKGTAIFVNSEQVTDQIVPWRSFLATQEGGMSAPPPAPVVAAKPVKTAAEKSEDDLFEEGDAPAPAAVKGTAKPAPVEPEPAVAFTPNARSAALVKRVNAVRLDVDKRLRAGDILFFGKNYARVTVDARTANGLLGALPDALRDANDGEDLHQRLRGRFPFMTRALCMDLLAHRADYVALAERVKAMQDSAKLQKMLDGSAR